MNKWLVGKIFLMQFTPKEVKFMCKHTMEEEQSTLTKFVVKIPYLLQQLTLMVQFTVKMAEFLMCSLGKQPKKTSLM